MKYMIAALCLVCALACSGNKREVTVVRTYQRHAGEEFLCLYSETNRITPVYGLYGTQKVSRTVVTENWCLTPGTYTLELTDTGFDGWEEGSNVKLLIGDREIGTYDMFQPMGTKNEKVIIPEN